MLPCPAAGVGCGPMACPVHRQGHRSCTKQTNDCLQELVAFRGAEAAHKAQVSEPAAPHDFSARRCMLALHYLHCLQHPRLLKPCVEVMCPSKDIIVTAASATSYRAVLGFPKQSRCVMGLSSCSIAASSHRVLRPVNSRQNRPGGRPSKYGSLPRRKGSPCIVQELVRNSTPRSGTAPCRTDSSPSTSVARSFAQALRLSIR